MRKIAASFIFPVSSAPLKNGIVVLDDHGVIRDIIDTQDNLEEFAGLEYYSGALVPGFVNCHCHLELSHMKGMIEQGIGLPGFIKSILSIRRNDEKTVLEAAQYADAEMRKNGIVAVGDISNIELSFEIKKHSHLYYHTFVELFGSDPLQAKNMIDSGMALVNKARNQYKLTAGITPHAPYSLSASLFRDILSSVEANDIVSLHNQETQSENELFISGKGKLAEVLTEVGLLTTDSLGKGRSSLQVVLPYLKNIKHIILIHNSFTGEEDVALMNNSGINNWWVTCPLSNIYIENKLPPEKFYQLTSGSLCLGTDSKASNTVLSILEEMKAIHRNYTSFDFDTLLNWACLNGAKALKIDQQFGSLEIGKKPGLNLITGFDFDNHHLCERSAVKVLA